MGYVFPCLFLLPFLHHSSRPSNDQTPPTILLLSPSPFSPSHMPHLVLCCPPASLTKGLSTIWDASRSHPVIGAHPCFGDVSGVPGTLNPDHSSSSRDVGIVFDIYL
ncbi:hypothetical protein BKA70DRAFT_739364 [Coprinopsis sp. MPI-PUGE-AT-0042]|nr:hypothetical protein BKA70DRAFT_739364 [Coprinopsis sp. MPI-PUGE-AT-0042]